MAESVDSLGEVAARDVWREVRDHQSVCADRRDAGPQDQSGLAARGELLEIAFDQTTSGKRGQADEFDELAIAGPSRRGTERVEHA